jgi:hypothetical protein
MSRTLKAVLASGLFSLTTAIAIADEAVGEATGDSSSTTSQATETQQAAPAQTAKVPGSGPNPFSDCGIGAALFANTKWAAVTSNIIWDVGITAITSATASPETCSGKRLATAQFINDNYDLLVEELALGEGQHLSAMMKIIDCPAAAQGAAISGMRTEMNHMLSSESYSLKSPIEKASDYYFMVSDSATNTCGRGV